MLYVVFLAVARVALRWFYRSVEIFEADCVPPKGAVILAANHPNAMVDALVIATSLRRRVRLTAKATLLDHAATRWLMRGLGIVPLRRASDESAPMPGTRTTDRNASAFQAVVATLGAGGVVLIFPEGRSHSEPELGSLRTGCARIALQAAADGVSPLVIVPVGLVFERKDRPRSRVAVRFGDPLPVTGAAGPHPDGVRDLTNELDAALREVTLNFESHDEAARVLEISQVLVATTERMRPLDSPEPSMGGTVEVIRRVNRARRVLPDVSNETADRVHRFVDRLDALRRAMQAADVPMTELWADIRWQAGLRFGLREVVVFSVAGPVALWGRLNHWIPLRIASWVGRATSQRPDEPAMHTLIAGVVSVLAYYAAVAATVSQFIGSAGTLVYLVSLPPASVDFWVTERWRHVVRRARAYFLFRRHPELQRRLVADAAALRADAERLEIELTQEPLAGRSRQEETGR